MASVFHLFPRLPTELRLKIWYQTLPLFPRIFELLPPDILEPNARFTNLNGESRWSPGWIVLVDHTANPLLKVNRKAREELLQHYMYPFQSVASACSYQNFEVLPLERYLVYQLGHRKDGQSGYDGFNSTWDTWRSLWRGSCRGSATLAENFRCWYRLIHPDKMSFVEIYVLRGYLCVPTQLGR